MGECDTGYSPSTSSLQCTAGAWTPEDFTCQECVDLSGDYTGHFFEVMTFSQVSCSGRVTPPFNNELSYTTVGSNITFSYIQAPLSGFIYGSKGSYRIEVPKYGFTLAEVVATSLTSATSSTIAMTMSSVRT